MTGRNKTAVEGRRKRMQDRGRYLYDNMTAAEKADHVSVFGQPPAKASDGIMKAYRMWAVGDLTTKKTQQSR